MNQKPRVLVSDKLSEVSLKIFEERGVDVDYQPGLGKNIDELHSVIHKYDGLAVRSATKVTSELLSKAENLKVIGRAGIGVDNIDLREATKLGVVVMNTPHGNSETTAEHAIAMLFSIARQIPEASSSTKMGRWEKSRFMGSELIGKTLGVIGCGNIGAGVCRRALGLGMRVVGYDPYLTEDRAQKIGVEKVELDVLLGKSDFITLHVPLTDKTRNLIDAKALQKTRQGVGIINCARGGIIDEKALHDALQDGRVSAAALDVFEVEPPAGNPLLELPNVVATPHLGASTSEAQEKVALQIAEQMSDYLVNGAVNNSLNMPSISAKEAKRMKPWIHLANHLGAFVGQMTDEPITRLEVLFDGNITEMNTKALSSVAIAGLLKVNNPEVNMVSAEECARELGLVISNTSQTKSGVFESYLKLTVETESMSRSIVGTVFSDGKPRIIQIKGIYIDADISRYMLYSTNKDRPGIIGGMGTILGKYNVNIASFNLGRSAANEDAIALLSLDTPAGKDVLEELRNSEMFYIVRPLEFDLEN
ncbi:MAG: phosphoglycerate dehydrogenase [Paracoccaceae bacterium]|nr:phosphoglycerate dehydrogenase [Paracoccaceae bacterium]MDE2674919.1 phosphoglycerate dehydrogenase [Paracoccaceae bacterium]MXZ51123.1 phosphoglycerate dehydrogenase [Paracoccaceae bacterium]MYF45321.1 phosphoglycerate dehydrogenase [Paracoccaceae bacterium]MYI91667.1 phosphoglycerate dehydrogenase [Paracoccaceae bacterium]